MKHDEGSTDKCGQGGPGEERNSIDHRDHTFMTPPIEHEQRLIRSLVQRSQSTEFINSCLKCASVDAFQSGLFHECSNEAKLVFVCLFESIHFLVDFLMGLQ